MGRKTSNFVQLIKFSILTCQDEVNPKVMEKVKAKPEPPVWINDAPVAAGHPDDDDINRIKEIINNLV